MGEYIKNEIELFIKKFDNKLNLKNISLGEYENINRVYVEFGKQNIEFLVNELKDYEEHSVKVFNVKLWTNQVNYEDAFCVYELYIPDDYEWRMHCVPGDGLNPLYQVQTMVHLISRNYKNIYHNYLNTKEWFDKRNISLEYANYKCCRCNETENLQIHHLNYNTVGDESIGDLEVVCNKCHKNIHKINN